METYGNKYLTDFQCSFSFIRVEYLSKNVRLKKKKKRRILL